jgi:hypothetical protein
VSHHIASTSHNNIPGPAAATPRGTLIVSRGKGDWCVFLFLSFFELTERGEMSVEGTTEAVFCCRVRGAMLVRQEDGRMGKTQEG